MVEGKIRSYRDLKIWQRAIDLVEEIYNVTRSFPSEEKFGLTSQMRRCSVSVPSNIAEGFGRVHNKEYRNFLFISIGSCAELSTQLTISARVGYLEKAKEQRLQDEIDQISRMIMSLTKKLNQK